MGKIELDHTGAGSGITLSSDGTDLLLNGTAIGGGGAALELYAENYDGTSTKPSATGTNGIALGRLAVASGTRSISLGGGATATGLFSTALTNSYASGGDAFAAAISTGSSSYGATGANSVAIGYQAKATGQYGFAVGDRSIASGTKSVAIGGTATASAGDGCTAIGVGVTASGQGAFAQGYINIASGSYSQAFGQGASTASIYGKFAKAAGYFSNYADMQAGILTVVAATTDATPKALTSNKAAASTNNQIILPNNSAYAFHGTIVARQQASAGTACAAWKIEGLIRREGSAGTTVLVNSATTVLDNTPAWGMALSADTTNGGLAITVTGAAATNIRWVATIHTSEVTY